MTVYSNKFYSNILFSEKFPQIIKNNQGGKYSFNIMYLRHKIGKLGEKIAQRYVEELGYNIIEKNFCAYQGEIDIIARDKSEIVFIEVKTRTNLLFGKPIEAVNTQKLKHLLSTIKYYIYLNNLQDDYIRIDVIEVFIGNEKYKLKHVKQII